MPCSCPALPQLALCAFSLVRHAPRAGPRTDSWQNPCRRYHYAEIVARASAFGRAAIRGLAEADGWRIVDRDATYTIAARRTKDAVALGRGLVRLLSPAIPSLAQVSVRRVREIYRSVAG